MLTVCKPEYDRAAKELLHATWLERKAKYDGI